MDTFTTSPCLAKGCKYLVGITLFLLMLAAPSRPSLSDETTEMIGGILVENAVVTPVKAGGTAHLRFKITNFGSNSVNLRGVRAKLARNGRLTMTKTGNGPKIVSNLLILSEETLNLATSHIRAELKTSTRP